MSHVSRPRASRPVTRPGGVSGTALKQRVLLSVHRRRAATRAEPLRERHRASTVLQVGLDGGAAQAHLSQGSLLGQWGQGSQGSHIDWRGRPGACPGIACRLLRRPGSPLVHSQSLTCSGPARQQRNTSLLQNLRRPLGAGPACLPSPHAHWVSRSRTLGQRKGGEGLRALLPPLAAQTTACLTAQAPGAAGANGRLPAPSAQLDTTRGPEAAPQATLLGA